MQTAVMENALPVSALEENAEEILTQIKKGGRVFIVEDGRVEFVILSYEMYSRLMEMVSEYQKEAG